MVFYTYKNNLFQPKNIVSNLTREYKHLELMVFDQKLA